MNDFTCNLCGGTFTKARPDEEAFAECAENFGEQDDLAVVCEDCFRKMTASLPPEHWEEQEAMRRHRL